MPRHESLTLPDGTWVEITASDTARITFQNRSSRTVLVCGTVAGGTPSADGALTLLPGQGVTGADPADLWPGIAAVRVHAIAEGGGRIMVSHA